MYMQQPNETGSTIQEMLQDRVPISEPIKGGDESVYTVYTKSGCPFCDKAKDLLRKWRQEDSAIHIVEHNCDMYLHNPEDKADFLRNMQQHCGKEWRTFPMIFHGDQFIGGYTDLVQYGAVMHTHDAILSNNCATAETTASSPPVVTPNEAQAFFESKWDEDMTF